WDVRKQGRLSVLRSHKEDIVAIAFSPNGQNVATGSLDGTARIWTLAGTPITTLSQHTGAVNDVEFSPDNRYVLTARDDHTVRVWKNTSSSDTVALLLGHKGAVTQAVYSPDGSRVLTASDDKTARLWDPRQPTFHVLAREDGPVVGASYAGRGRIVVAG